MPFRVMFIGQGPSGLPQDRVVNTFHFEGGIGSVDEAQQDAMDRVTDFYNGAGSGVTAQANTLASYISAWVSRNAELRAYDMSAALPRIPTVRALTLNDSQSLNGYPEEVALCISISGSPPLTARRRGRIFLGPLIAAAGVPSSTTAACRPTDALIADASKAALRMATTAGDAGYWSIKSERPTVNYVTVTRGWVDNAFDTQRRRGPDATLRQEWTGLLGLL